MKEIPDEFQVPHIQSISLIGYFFQAALRD